jgi:alkaline phosphatase D
VLFFRFFPAHFPSITLALFAIYVPSFIATYLAGPQLAVINDHVDMVEKDTVAETKTPLLTEDGVAVQSESEVIGKEVLIQEKVTLAPKVPSPMQILLRGSPSSKRPLASALTFLVNSVLVLMTADALFRARIFHQADDLSFVRLGYVSPSEANFLVREPDQANMPLTLEVHILNPQGPYDAPQWQHAGAVTATANETDFTSIITVPLTHPHQRVYQWRTSNNHTGQFLAPPKAGSMPEVNGGKFTFLSTSCILPRFPYNPLDHPLAIPGLRHLARKLPELQAQFMLFLGDFIYVDVPERFGKTKEEYRMQYRQVYASPDWQAVAQNLSWLHVLDDHEISNDWSSKQEGVYKAAVEPWHIYQANVNPPRATLAAASGHHLANATWFEFTQGPASFFLMDTRSYRSQNNDPSDAESKSMLGQDQLVDFEAWLARPEPQGVRWKIVASSVPLTKNWPVNTKDTWGGFLAERKRVLQAMWSAGQRGYGVVVLSGDRHEFAATKFPPPADSEWPEVAAAYEFSTSPLNQFASPIPSYKQVDDEDVMLKYIPSGTSKFGSFTIENIAGQSSLQYRLYIDGEETWTTTIVAPPMPVEEVKIKSGSIWDRIKW